MCASDRPSGRRRRTDQTDRCSGWETGSRQAARATPDPSVDVENSFAWPTGSVPPTHAHTHAVTWKIRRNNTCESCASQCNQRQAYTMCVRVCVFGVVRVFRHVRMSSGGGGPATPPSPPLVICVAAVKRCASEARAFAHSSWA